VDIRQAVPGVIALAITHELDGSSAIFGERVWQLLKQQAPHLADHLHRAMPLQSVCYADRYLRSPLAFVFMLDGAARSRLRLLGSNTPHPSGISL